MAPSDVRPRSRSTTAGRVEPAGIGESSLEGLRAGVVEAPVDVEQGHGAARQAVGERSLDEPAVRPWDDLRHGEVERLAVQLEHERQDDADSDRGRHREQEGGHERRDERDSRRVPGAEDGCDLADSQRPDGGEDEHGCQRRHRDLRDDAREEEQDHEDPEADEDPGPARAGTGAHVQRGRPDGTAHREASHEPRGDVPDTLGHEVAVRVRRPARLVGGDLGDARALDEDDRGDREGGGDEVEREQPELREVREREPRRDRALVLDALDLLEAESRDRGDRERQHRRERADPGPREDDRECERCRAR